MRNWPKLVGFLGLYKVKYLLRPELKSDLLPRFGSVMLENLMSRGCQLSGVSACKDSSAQISRYVQFVQCTVRKTV